MPGRCARGFARTTTYKRVDGHPQRVLESFGCRRLIVRRGRERERERLFCTDPYEGHPSDMGKAPSHLSTLWESGVRGSGSGWRVGRLSYVFCCGLSALRTLYHNFHRNFTIISPEYRIVAPYKKGDNQPQLSLPAGWRGVPRGHALARRLAAQLPVAQRRHDVEGLGQDVCDMFPAGDAPEGISFSNEIL